MATVTSSKRQLTHTSNTYESNGDVTIGGNLNINGTTTTIDTANLLVEDKNIIIGDVSSPTDSTADGGGITLKGASDKTINWVNSTDSWTSNQKFSAPTLTLTGLTTSSETTALLINASNQVVKRVLGSNAFNSTTIPTNNNQLTNGASYITGNQTITLSGDVSGSGTTSISVTVADDSHNHIISNVDGLQSALDGKATAGDENIIDGATSIWNADGDGDVFVYNDSNPTHNGKYAGAVLNIRGDGSADSSLVRAGVFTSDHVSTANGYYVGTLLGNANSTTTQVINSSGAWTGSVIPAAKLSTATTQSSSENSTKIATTAYVKNQGYVTSNTQLSNETVQDIVGGMLTGNTESGITVTYDDAANEIDFTVASQTDQNFTTTLKNKLDGIAASANNYSLPAGSSSTRGGFKIGFSESGKNYPVEVSSEKMYVNVPWADTNTTYSVGDGGLTQKNFTSTLKSKLDGIAASANNYSLPAGSSSTRGGFKIGFSESGKNYPVEVSSEKMYVNVPWTDTNTTYSVGDGGLTQKNFTSTLKSKLDGIAASANNYSLPAGSSSTRGGFKIGFSESGKNYPVEVSSEKMYVNVPWTDTNTNTTYSAGTGITLSGTTFSLTDTASKANLSGATFTGDVTIGNGSADTNLHIKKSDNNVSDHIVFYNGTTRVGEIGVEDTSWLRINQETAKNIYTPRYIRADAGFFVDGTSKGINGSGNFIGGTITGASDANVSNWNTAYGWGNHASAGYVTSSGNTIIGTDSDINTSGATVIDQLNMTDGVIQSHSTRTLTLANLGYTGATNANNYSLPAGSSSTRGGFKIGYTESGKYYPVEVDSSEKMFVNVPWVDTNTNTTYSVGDGGLTQKNFTSTLKTKLDGIATSANNYSLPAGSSSTRGGFKIGFSETGKYYPVETSSEKMFVHVPWVDTNTDTNTTYSAGRGLDLSGTQFLLETDLRDSISYIGYDSNDYVQWSNNSYFRSVVNGSERFRVNTSGIDVTGTATANAFRTDTGNTDYSVISRNSTSGSLYVQAAQSNSTQTILTCRYGSATVNQGTEVLAVRKNSSYFINTKLGVGTSSPSTALHINGTITHTIYYPSSFPSASPAGQRAFAYSFYPLATSHGSVVSTNGSYVIPVYSDGSSWRAG